MPFLFDTSTPAVGRAFRPSGGADPPKIGAIAVSLLGRLRSKQFLRDIVIGVTATRIGAHIVTDDEKDFAIIDRWFRTRRLSADGLLKQ